MDNSINAIRCATFQKSVSQKLANKMMPEIWRKHHWSRASALVTARLHSDAHSTVHSEYC